MREWERMPIPLASFGLSLRVSDEDFYHRIFVFMEATVALAVSYGLARVCQQQGWSTGSVDVRDALERSSLGKRMRLIRALPCGWDLNSRSEAFRSVVRAAYPGQKIRRTPSVGNALDAIVTARNKLVHPTIPNVVAHELPRDRGSR